MSIYCTKFFLNKISFLFFIFLYFCLQSPGDDALLTKQYVDYNYSTGTSGSFTNAREVMKRFDLAPGQYIIVPCSFKPGEEGDFLLRIFTESYSEE